MFTFEHQGGPYDVSRRASAIEKVTGAGIEPAARALKVRCSTTELPGREVGTISLSPCDFAQGAPSGVEGPLQNFLAQRGQRQLGPELRGGIAHIKRGVDLDEIERDQTVAVGNDFHQ
jgi:hypothetical protein